jgi:hypothetical protein
MHEEHEEDDQPDTPSADKDVVEEAALQTIPEHS